MPPRDSIPQNLQKLLVIPLEHKAVSFAVLQIYIQKMPPLSARTDRVLRGLKHPYENVTHTNPNDQPFVNTKTPYQQIQELKLILMISKSSVSIILPWRSPTLVQPSNSYRPRFDERFLDATLKIGFQSLVASNVFIILYFFRAFRREHQLFTESSALSIPCMNQLSGYIWIFDGRSAPKLGIAAMKLSYSK